MKKLIISDFDGTLVNSEEEIPTSTVMLIDVLRRKGYKFGIATGRCIKSILDYNHDFHFIDYIISSNGAYIYDTEKEKVIYKKNILISNVKKIIKLFYDKATIYLTDNVTWNLISENSAYEDDFDVIKVDDYEKFLEENKTNIYKIETYFNSIDDVKDALEEIKKLNLKVNVNIQINGNKYLLEITHVDVNKYEGLVKVCAKEKIDIKDVIAFGDGHNDIDLIKNAGVGVAVLNAVEELKKVASDITEDCNHKGVEKYLRKLD